MNHQWQHCLPNNPLSQLGSSAHVWILPALVFFVYFSIGTRCCAKRNFCDLLMNKLRLSPAKFHSRWITDEQFFNLLFRFEFWRCLVVNYMTSRLCGNRYGFVPNLGCYEYPFLISMDRECCYQFYWFLILQTLKSSCFISCCNDTGPQSERYPTTPHACCTVRGTLTVKGSVTVTNINT